MSDTLLLIGATIAISVPVMATIIFLSWRNQRRWDQLSERRFLEDERRRLAEMDRQILVDESHLDETKERTSVGTGQAMIEVPMHQCPRCGTAFGELQQ